MMSEVKMQKACLCYSCDKNYLLPTVVSALQARENLSREVADIIILVVGGFQDPRHAVANLLRENDVKMHIVDRGEIGNVPVQFVRHLLDALIEPAYERVIHIDSDTQIVGSLDPLFKVDLPAGYLMACPDPMAIRIREHTRFWTDKRDYFRKIGIFEHNIDSYVNTGIFGGGRGDLASASRDCLALIRGRREPLRWHEQDSFNVVVGDRFKYLSLKWNFASFLLGCGLQDLLQPRVLHYMSNPRPWHGTFKPWNKKAHDVYVHRSNQQPALEICQTRISPLKMVRYHMQQAAKQLIESRTWTRSAVIRRIAELEQSSIV